MRLLNFDIVVVGAGPAGCIAAESAAKSGANVLLLEEHPKVGEPVYCAEGLSLNGVKDAGVEPKPPIVCQEITKAKVFAPNKSFVELTSTDWRGYTLNRDVFDRFLSENAVKAGAKLMTNTKATRVIVKDGLVTGVEAINEGEKLEISVKIVIGADGYSSITRRTAGLGRWFPDYVTCAQFKLGNITLDEPNVNEFYLGSKVSPGGYAWVFPKSSQVANVGLGVRRIHVKPPIDYLKDFVKSDPRFKNSNIISVNGGICPVSGCINKAVDDGVMLVGDAAGQLIPMTGAGIHSGIAAGRMAGDVAAEAVKTGDVSASRLSEYESRFDIYWGKRIRDSLKVVKMLDKFNDSDLNTLASVITNEDIINLANGIDVAKTLAKIVSRSPLKIVRLISAFLRK